MNHWIIKSEPTTYSISHLKKDKQTAWEGVRNYQARNFLRDGFKVGDRCLFYHSSSELVGIAGIAKVKKVDLPDQTQFDKKSDYYDPKATPQAPIWYAPLIQFEKEFKNIITPKALRATKGLEKLMILKQGNRLSVTPVNAEEFAIIIKLAA